MELAPEVICLHRNNRARLGARMKAKEFSWNRRCAWVWNARLNTWTLTN